MTTAASLAARFVARRLGAILNSGSMLFRKSEGSVHNRSEAATCHYERHCRNSASSFSVIWGWSDKIIWLALSTSAQPHR